ncbi:MAG: tetratricopeptide repeat protein [Proteobacteria bacterium]|nr:tetratricopeptide repeat protein [Pseudomonadota bacterium]
MPARFLLAALIIGVQTFASAGAEGNEESSAHVLQAEIALQADDYLKAAREYRKAAELSDNVDIARQATRIAYGFGLNAEALRSAKRWRELDEESDDALRVVAQLELRTGDLRAARRNFKKYIESGDEPGEERLFSLLPVLAAEDGEKADQVMRWLAKPYKDSALVNYASAALALQGGDAGYATKKSLRAIALSPEWLKPKLLYARALLLNGEKARAIDYTARIIGDDPNPDPDARMELALILMSVGRIDDALSQVNQILLEHSGRTDALRLMAIINFRQNNLDAAWDDFEDLLASRSYTMDALYYLARIADIRGEHDRAIFLYSQVDSGQNALAAQRRAGALIAYQHDDPEQALQRLEEFATENPNYAVDMILARAQLLASLGRYTEALESYDRVVTYRPEDEGTALGRAELLLRMGRLDDALDEYRRSVRRWPESALSLNALGYTLADRTEEYREAEKLIRKALRHDPDSPAIIDSLGWVLYKLGEHEAALEQLQVAYESFADHEVAAHLVDVLVTLRRNSEALKLLVAAEQQDPDSELLRDVRERRFPDAD